MLTRCSAAAAVGVHTHTYSSAASETAATKKAPVLPLLLLSGPSPSARIDTDTAACSSDSTPADDVDTHLVSQQALVSWAFANCSWLRIEAAAADSRTRAPTTQYHAASAPAALRVFLLESPVACQTATWRSPAATDAAYWPSAVTAMLLAAACRVCNPLVTASRPSYQVVVVMLGASENCVLMKPAHRVPCVFEQSALLGWIPCCDCCAGSKGACAIWRHRQRSQWVLPRLKASNHATISRVQAHQLPVRPSYIQSAGCCRPCHCPHAPAWYAGTIPYDVCSSRLCTMSGTLPDHLRMHRSRWVVAQVLTPR